MLCFPSALLEWMKWYSCTHMQGASSSSSTILWSIILWSHVILHQKCLHMILKAILWCRLWIKLPPLPVHLAKRNLSSLSSSSRWWKKFFQKQDVLHAHHQWKMLLKLWMMTFTKDARDVVVWKTLRVLFVHPAKALNSNSVLDVKRCATARKNVKTPIGKTTSLYASLKSNALNQMPWIKCPESNALKLNVLNQMAWIRCLESNESEQALNQMKNELMPSESQIHTRKIIT